jgi:arylsulfatase A-like enzyme
VLDRQVKKVIERLKLTGEYRNTVIMFTSDNGYFLGEHRVRQGKVKPHEPSLRVPFMIAGPGIPAGRTRYDPIMTPDITATITDLGNVSTLMAAHRVPDGSSKLPTIRHGDRGWAVPVVTEAMLRHPFERVKNVKRGFDDARDSIGLRTARYKFVRYATGETELYDLNRDPNELRSVDRNPAYRPVRQQLASLWWQYKDCKGDSCRVPLPSRLRAGPRIERTDTRMEIAGRKARNGYAY